MREVLFHYAALSVFDQILQIPKKPGRRERSPMRVHESEAHGRMRSVKNLCWLMFATVISRTTVDQLSIQQTLIFPKVNEMKGQESASQRNVGRSSGEEPSWSQLCRIPSTILPFLSFNSLFLRASATKSL